MKFSRKVMLSEVARPWLLFAILIGCARCEGLCERRITWWDRERSLCIPCTRCEPHLAVKFPCELHRDTICQPLHELHRAIFPETDRNIRNNDSELSDFEYYDELVYEDEVSDEDTVRWDLLATTLTLAAIGCVVFFAVVIYVTFYHTKQWKVLKKALRSDVQDLSAKLKLMEEGKKAPDEQVVATDHHIYCNVHVTKDALLKPKNPGLAKKGLGNVYTQDKHPT